MALWVSHSLNNLLSTYSNLSKLPFKCSLPVTAPRASAQISRSGHDLWNHLILQIGAGVDLATSVFWKVWEKSLVFQCVQLFQVVKTGMTTSTLFTCHSWTCVSLLMIYGQSECSIFCNSSWRNTHGLISIFRPKIQAASHISLPPKAGRWKREHFYCQTACSVLPTPGDCFH